MAIIYSYPLKNSPTALDRLIITDVSSEDPKNQTKQITIQKVLDLFSAAQVSSISTTNGTYIDLTPVGPATGDVTVSADLNTDAATLLNAFSVTKVVCAPVTNVAGPPNAGDGIPDNGAGVTWYFNNTLIQKWEVTGTNAPLKQEHIGNGNNVNLQVIISGGCQPTFNVEWSLRLYTLDRSNYYQLAASTLEPGTNNVGQPLVSNGATTSGNDFTNCWVETKITGIDLATAFFGDFGVTEGEIELWARNPNNGSYIISSCTVDFYS